MSSRFYVPVFVFLIGLWQALPSISPVSAETSITWHSPQSLQQSLTLTPTQSLLEIQVSYDRQSPTLFTITKAQIKNGYPPKPSPDQHPYNLHLLDAQGQILLSHPFSVPDTLLFPPPLPGESAANDRPLVYTQLTFPLTVAWVETATAAVIQDSQNQELARFPLTNLPRINNAQSFQTLKGGQLVQELEPETDVSQAQGGSTTTGATYLDVTFISDGYTSSQMGTFQNDVSRFSSHLLTYEPFKSRANQIWFHSVQNIQSLNCSYNGRLLTCDTNLALQAINSAGVPYDTVVIIVNNPTYGGSGGSVAVSYNGTQGPQVFVHELGHSLASLVDEYYLNWPNLRTDKNCYNGTPPNSAWSGIVPTNSYFQECNMSTWYRSTNESIMRVLSAQYFNPISQKFLNESISYYAPPAKTGDFDNSGYIDYLDYKRQKSQFNLAFSLGDFNQNGKIDVFDLNTLLKSLFK